YDRLIDDPGVYSEGHEAGVMQERQVWESARNQLLAQQDAERRKAQARIDAAETRYLDHRTGDALKIGALEQALQEAKNNVQNTVCAGAPAIPGGVSKYLTALGADRPVAVKPELARVPQALKLRCAAPSDIP